jgi:hypothetical protein
MCLHGPRVHALSVVERFNSTLVYYNGKTNSILSEMLFIVCTVCVGGLGQL